MISNLYVIDNGLCIYSYTFKKTITISEQLFSGLLTALGAFAQETFKTGLQTIQIQNGQNLVFYLDSGTKIMFCALADSRDNDYLLEKYLKEIGQKFIQQMTSILNSPQRDNIDHYLKFNETLETFFRFKTRKRDLKYSILGLLSGFLLLLLSNGVNNIITNYAKGIYDDKAVLTIFLAFFCLILFLATFLSGYIAGNPKIGLKTGLIFLTIFCVSLYFGDYETFINFLAIFPYVLLTCLAGGYSGGLLCDRQKLYPLEK
jgi:hypothetical protein